MIAIGTKVEIKINNITDIDSICEIIFAIFNQRFFKGSNILLWNNDNKNNINEMIIAQIRWVDSS